MRRSFSLVCLLFIALSLVADAPVRAAGLSVTSLCYHQVLPVPKGLFETSTADFRRQLQMIRRQGFESIDSAELLEILAGHPTTIEKPILITFDDGYASVFTHARPLMREFGFKGIVCIYPEFIGTGGGMSWDQLRQLASEGWSIESHSMTHADLYKGSRNPASREAFFAKEIARPKKIIEEQLGRPARLMVWPYGIYTREAEAYARNCGYLGAVTVDGGASYPGLSPFQVKRQIVYRTDSDEKFGIRLAMSGLPLTDPAPAPGTEVETLKTIRCRLPEPADYSPEKHNLSVMVSGAGKIPAVLDPTTRELTATCSKSLKPGHHFIDVYIGAKDGSWTRQHGWLVTTTE